MNKYYWDLETGPESDERLAKMKPEFLPDARLVDPEKIKASIKNKEADWKERAALSAMTGKILAVTLAGNDEEPEFVTGDEHALIERVLSEICDPALSVYTWNGANFDIPFLLQRAAINNIPAFKALTTKFRGRYYFCEHFTDALQVWNMSHQHVAGSGLGAVALALGVGEKNGDGKDFAELLKSDPAKAEAYAVNDVNLLRKIVTRLGI